MGHYQPGPTVLINICCSHLTSIDHNQYIVKGLSYQSNYQAGVRIQSIDQDNFELTEVASFQTTLSDPISEFGYGTWTNYPYFIDEGMWMYSIVVFVLLTCSNHKSAQD